MIEAYKSAMWGRQSCLQAAFRRLLRASWRLGPSSPDSQFFARRQRRLKAGGSQDWLPHNPPNPVTDA
jgi:hypothetical protein